MATSVKADKPEVITIDIKSFVEPGARILSALILGLCLIISANIIAGSGAVKGVATAAVSSSSTSSAAADNTPNTGSNMATSIDTNAVLGDKSKAKVAIVEFSDFECPYCKTFYQTTLPTIKSNYIDTGKAILVYRYLPLSFHEPAASLEAEAAECVHQLAGDTAFYKMHDKMFDTTQSNGSGITLDQLGTIATGIGGINVTDLKNCISTAKYQTKITNDSNAAAALGINGTPGFVIGKLGSDGSVTGEYVSGAQAYGVFQSAINNYL